MRCICSSASIPLCRVHPCSGAGGRCAVTVGLRPLVLGDGLVRWPRQKMNAQAPKKLSSCAFAKTGRTSNQLLFAFPCLRQFFCLAHPPTHPRPLVHPLTFPFPPTQPRLSGHNNSSVALWPTPSTPCNVFLSFADACWAPALLSSVVAVLVGCSYVEHEIGLSPGLWSYLSCTVSRD